MPTIPHQKMIVGKNPPTTQAQEQTRCLNMRVGNNTDITQKASRELEE